VDARGAERHHRLDERLPGTHRGRYRSHALNLALTYGVDVADAYRRAHRALAGAGVDNQTYWDVVTVLDLVHDLDPTDWPRFDLERLDRYLEGRARPRHLIKLPGSHLIWPTSANAN
jgi:hypothetical protein